VDRIDPRRGVWLIAAGRVALGLAVLAAPEQVTARWLGEDNAALPVVGDLARSLGARDLALGVITLRALDDPVSGARAQRLCALVDAADALATVLARKSLPRKGVYGTVAIAGSAAAAGLYWARELASA
jgi:hypothetical protein